MKSLTTGRATAPSQKQMFVRREQGRLRIESVGAKVQGRNSRRFGDSHSGGAGSWIELRGEGVLYPFEYLDQRPIPIEEKRKAAPIETKFRRSSTPPSRPWTIDGRY